MRLVTIAISRDETPYLLQWVAYQHLIGSEQVLIYDNGHDAEGTDLLRRLHEHGVIECVPWRQRFPHGPQVPAYDDALSRVRGTTDWALICDLDEYVVPVLTDTLSELLDEATDLDAMWFPWLIFGSSGELSYRPQPLIERFQRREQVDDTTVTPVKSAVRPDHVVAAHLHVHPIDSDAYANPLGERNYLRASDGVSRRSAQFARGADVARTHHYMTKSAQEWAHKVARGRADRGYADEQPRRKLDEFDLWNRNAVRDTTALRFLQPLHQEMARIEKLIE
ncbi:glycosyltransferase family 2 protein [Plantactinospora sp. CA-290183]|uniref:glycosyltransferase family 2 protein n=1 Tax=Plantactinospora sp. CA-290183 TaxID=3240006 RepID=UPI003D8A14A8